MDISAIRLLLNWTILKYAMYLNPTELDKYVKSRIVKDKFNFVFSCKENIEEDDIGEGIKNIMLIFEWSILRI